MKLQWERPGVLRLTARVEELATLVAGGRLAATAMRGDERESSRELARVLADFDRAARAVQTKTPAEPRQSADPNERGADQ